MGMAILFRNTDKQNPFRESLLELASWPGDELILTTGTVDEGVYYNEDTSYNHKLAECIRQGFTTKSGEVDGIIRICGGRFWEHNKVDYCATLDKSSRKFVPNIGITSFLPGSGCNLCSFNHLVLYLAEYFKGTNVTVRRYHDSNWHAKIAVKIKNKKHISNLVGTIVGSSNLTERSFGFHTHFNSECDVFMWNRRILSSHNINCSIDTLTTEDIITYREKFIDILPVKLRDGLAERNFATVLIQSLSLIRSSNQVIALHDDINNVNINGCCQPRRIRRKGRDMNVTY